MPVRIYFQSWGRLLLLWSFSSSLNQWQGKEGDRTFGILEGLVFRMALGGKEDWRWCWGLEVMLCWARLPSDCSGPLPPLPAVSKQFQCLLAQVSFSVCCLRSQLHHARSLFVMRGLSSCGARAYLLCSWWDPSSLIRNRTLVPCIVWQILNHWTTNFPFVLLFSREAKWE